MVDSNDAHPERRKSEPPWHADMLRLEQRLVDMHTETCDTLKNISSDLTTMRDILEAWRNLKGAAVVLNTVGRGAQKISKWALAIGALYYAIKHGMDGKS